MSETLHGALRLLERIARNPENLLAGWTGMRKDLDDFLLAARRSPSPALPQAGEVEAIQHLRNVLNTQPSYSLERGRAEEAARKFLDRLRSQPAATGTEGEKA